MWACLVAGGAGFIGSHLVEALLASGHKVRVLDNFSTGSFANLSRVMSDVDLIPGDAANFRVVREAMEGTEIVFHLAHGAMFVDPHLSVPREDLGTRQILRCAHAAGVRRVVCASTFRVTDLQRGHGPRSPYAAARLAIEEQCAAFTRDFGLATVCLRYVRVFGPRQPAASLDWPGILPVLRAVFTNRRPLIKGTDGEPQDLIYVEDAVHAALLAAEAERVGGRVYDIGRGRTTTMREILATLHAISNVEMHPIYVSGGPGGDLPKWADMSHAEIALGFCPSVDLEQGLRRCLADMARSRVRY